jgi:hypothetical protein
MKDGPTRRVGVGCNWQRRLRKTSSVRALLESNPALEDHNDGEVWPNQPVRTDHSTRVALFNIVSNVFMFCAPVNGS